MERLLHFPGFKKEKVFSELQLCYNVILILLTLSETADDSCMSTVVVVFYDARAPPGGHLDHYTCQAWIKWDQQNTQPHFGQFISNHDTMIVVFFKIKCSIHSHYFIYKIFFPLKRWVGEGGGEGAGPLCTPINHINQLRRRSGTQDSHGACETKWACVGRYVTLGGGRVEPNLTTVLTVADLGLFRRRSQRNSRSRLLSSASSRRFS